MKKFFIVVLLIFCFIPSFCFAKTDTQSSQVNESINGTINITDPDISIYKLNSNGILVPAGYDDDLNGSYLFKKTILSNNHNYTINLIVRCYLDHGRMDRIVNIIIDGRGKIYSGNMYAEIVNSNSMVYDLYGDLYNQGSTTHSISVGANGKIINGSYTGSYTSSFYDHISESGSIWMSDRI